MQSQNSNFQYEGSNGNENANLAELPPLKRKKKDDFDSNKIKSVADDMRVQFEKRTNKNLEKVVFGHSLANKMDFKFFFFINFPRGIKGFGNSSGFLIFSIPIFQ